MESTVDLLQKVRTSEEMLDVAQKIIAYVCRNKVSVDLPKPPDMRQFDDTALDVIASEAVDGQAEWNAATAGKYPPFEAALFMETSGLRYWRALCRRHAAICELLIRRQA